MKIIDRIDKKYTIGLLVGLFFGILSIYVDFIKTHAPQFSVEILSNAKVLDIKENIGNLDVLYDSTSLTKQNKTISLITLKISNKGNEPILKEHFDTIAPLSFYIRNTKIVQKPQVIDNNEEYLKRSLIFYKINDSCYALKPFIFDIEKYAVIKFIVLHDDKSAPIVEVNGKISKVTEFEVLNSFSKEQKKGFWQSVFDGSIIIHIARFFIYIILFGLLLGPLFKINESIYDSRARRKRKAKIKLYKSYKSGSLHDFHPELFHMYIYYDNSALIQIKNYLLDITKYEELLDKVRNSGGDNDITYFKNFIDRLTEKGLINITDKITVNEDFLRSLNDLIEFTKI